MQISSVGHLVYLAADDASVASLLAPILSRAGFRVVQFETDASVLNATRSDPPNMVVLDISMARQDPLIVVKEIRRTSQVPIFMITSADVPWTTVAALDLGADDCLVKPFRHEELLARMRAILRRNARGQGTGMATFSDGAGDLCIDMKALIVTKQGQRVSLTPREWSLLGILVAHAGQVVSCQSLLQQAWGPSYGNEVDYVRTYIKRLRQKLETEPKGPRYILLERGFGYRLVAPHPAALAQEPWTGSTGT